MQLEFREKLVTSVWVGSLLSFTIFMFGPTYIYFTNVNEVPYLYSEVWHWLLLASLISLLVISVFLVILRPIAHRVSTVFLCALGTLLWAQGNVMVWKYGVMDGKAINWNEFIVYGLIDTAVWLVYLTAVMIKRDYFYKMSSRLSMGLIVIQIISLGITCFQAPQQPDWKRFAFDGQDKFTFSSKQNVIIVVLDSFQTDVFQELINEHPEYRKIFKGFTYFRNSVGGFPTTYPSVPLILTGRYYDNSVPVQDFIKKAYSTSSIPLTLKQNGYRVDLFTHMPSVYPSDKIASNIVLRKDMSDKRNELLQLYNVTLFRYTPHFIKKYFYFDSAAEDFDFARQVSNEVNSASDKYTFKFFHLRGTHPPFRYNENLAPQDLEFDRTGYKTQARAALEVTKRFLESLKKASIYDNSMIFVVADHGLDSLGLNVKLSGYQEKSSTPKRVSDNIISRGIPLVLVKPFNSNGELKTSDAPVSLSDIPKTIASQLGLENKFSGKSMFEISNSEVRRRHFLAYTWTHEYWNKQYLPNMQEYAVTGFSWLRQSWIPEYRKLTPQGVINTPPPAYRYGSPILFGSNGNAKGYQGAGWASSENGFAWTNGDSASLIMAVKKPRSELIMSADLTPYVSGNLKNQRIHVYANGNYLGTWIVGKRDEYKITIPSKYISNSLLELNFECPDAVSPFELKESNDNRVLGVAVKSICIAERPFYKYNSKIQFGIKGNAQQFQTEGWSNPEQIFTWTEGNRASLSIPLSSPRSDVQLKAVVSPLIDTKIKSQKVVVWVNGKKIGEWVVKGLQEQILSIPRELITGSNLKIDFDLPDAISPKQLNLSNDSRLLGLAFHSVTLLEQ